MIGYIYISGEIGGDTNLIDVIRQVKAQPNAIDFIVKIDSQGGYVNVGYDIYNYLKNLPQNVTTVAHRAYSIASVIFMAGSTRIVPENAENVLMIHLPWMEVAGNHETITAHLSGLKNEEDKLIKFYSEALQIDQETIQSLLSKETYLSSEEANQMGFATQIQAAPKAVAKLINNKKEDESLMNKLTKKLSQIFNKLNGIKAELVLQDATGAELVFPDLEASDVAEVGEKATVDGKPAEGDFIMPDGSTIRISGGIVSEIVPAEVEEDALVEEPVAEQETKAEEIEPQAEVDEDKFAALEKKVANLEAKIAELMGGTPVEQNAEVENKMLEVVAMAAEKVNELQTKYEALAKSVGSDYQPSTKKESTPSIKASEEEKPKFSIKRK